MTEEQLIQQIMMAAFADELEKVSTARGLGISVSEIEKIAIRAIPRRIGESVEDALKRQTAERVAKRKPRVYSRSAQFGTKAERKASREMTGAVGHGAVDASPGYASTAEQARFGRSIT